ncbi:MAG: hypothetical protein LQ343_008039 [Gyalolechia ehrenbergii]|nr:MAG: hypothetical protein LQ343_008039 [Gyalolechia ehrenbergii]
MTHFRGTDYRAHTSCLSEAQKYQGTLYKEKPSKQAKKSVKISSPSSRVPRNAFVEDAPDADSNAVTIVDPPPEAPTPPPAVKNLQPVNVFDFLVAEDTPNASKISLGGTRAQMEMKPHAPPLFDAQRRSESSDSGTDHHYDSAYERDGYTYGTDPVPSTSTLKQPEYKTPAPKHHPQHSDSQPIIYELDGAHRTSTDKKRKRQHLEDLDLTAAGPPSRQELDSVMIDNAPTPVLHSGLTGGLNRLLSKSTNKFLPSPEYSASSQQQDPSPPSPVKRTKRIVTTVDGEKVRKTSSGALVRIRKAPSSRRASDESSSRPTKHQRSSLREASDTRPRREMKSIEYRRPTSTSSSHHHHRSAEQHKRMILFRSRAELFLSFVTKGPESEHGCSINKALKRYHRERGVGLERKQEEEKELWKSLRVRRNERGEVVILGA